MATQEQLNRFQQKGCLPRSLIYLVRERIQLTPSQFIDTYHNCFREGDDFGMLSEAGLWIVLEGLGLKAINGFDQYTDAQTAFDAGDMVLVSSTIQFLPLEATNVINHTSVLTAINPAEFTVWTPNQNGNDGQIPLPSQCWANKGCSALILQWADESNQ